MKNRFVSLFLISTFLLTQLAATAWGEVKIKNSGSTVEVFVSGKPVMTYQAETVQPPPGMEAVYARSGFIHPLHSPSGKILTDDFPIGHVHQHAIYSAWTMATVRHEMVDFWNQNKGTGTVKHLKIGQVTSDSFEAELQQISLKKGPAIHEEWKVKVSDSADPFIIDIEIGQSCATENEVYLHPYHYGGFAFRGSAHWSSEDPEHFEGLMKVLTRDGVTDIIAGNNTRPGWIAVHGLIKGKEAGFVVMDHPSNFRHPQPIRLHPKMPYFVFSPVIEGSFILQPGFSYVSNFRIITFDGEPDKAQINGWYAEYAGNGKK